MAKYLYKKCFGKCPYCGCENLDGNGFDADNVDEIDGLLVGKYTCCGCGKNIEEEYSVDYHQTKYRKSDMNKGFMDIGCVHPDEYDWENQFMQIKKQYNKGLVPFIKMDAGKVLGICSFVKELENEIALKNLKIIFLKKEIEKLKGESK